MTKRYSLIATIVLAGLLLSGCLEQLSTTRLPAGAAHNFFYFMSLGQKTEANAYWAPDYVPADSDSELDSAIAKITSYEFQYGKSDTEHSGDNSVILTLRGRERLKGTTEWSDDIALMRADMIERGPGWRVTSFEILCCGAATPGPTTTPVPGVLSP